MLKRLLLCSFLVLLGACEGQFPIKPGNSAGKQVLNNDPVVAQRQLQQHLLTAKGSERAKTLLKLGQLQIAGKNYATANNSLNQVQGDLLSHHQRVELLCWRAQLLHHQGRARDGVKILPKNKSNFPPALQRLVLDSQATVLKSAGYDIEATRARINLQPLLQTAKLRSKNAKSIISSLSALPGDNLEQLLQKHISPVVDSWVDFVKHTKPQLFSISGFDTAVQQWRNSHRYQQVPEQVIAEMRATIQGQGKQSRPQKIALLLPLSSRFAKQAQSIRDGFLAAYYQHENTDKPEIILIDSTPELGSIEDKLNVARQKGADMVVGPLLKSSIESIKQIPQLPLPVLALNYVNGATETERQPGFYQFGLHPEDEIRQAVQLALLRNQNKAVIMAPNTNKGRRLASAFEESYQANGGRVLTTQFYESGERDFSNPIKSVLNAQHYTRRDIDVIYMIANPTQARGIKPQLKFHDAGYIDVLGNSQIFNGQSNPKLNKDINGVVFTQTPWLLKAADTPLHQQLKSLWAAGMARHGELYAFGADAFNILPYLSRMGSDATYTLDGYTGTLSISEQGKVQRQLLWARFTKGLAELEDYSLLTMTQEESTPLFNAEQNTQQTPAGE